MGFREEYFCVNYSHRCFTRFYGIVMENNKKKGYLYEFMSNENLSSFIQKNKTDYFLSFIILNRIFQGIEYIHSNSFIHRDISSTNILLDHDNLPYISDFETIREITQEYNDNTEFTYNFGSYSYISPEQYYGWLISMPTDIYSYGILIYNIFEKKKIVANENQLKKMFSLKNKNIPKLNSCSSNIIKIYESCLMFDQKERINNYEIKSLLFKEMNAIFDDENVFNESLQIKDDNEIFHYFYENLLFMKRNEYSIDDYLLKIYVYFLIRFSKTKNDNLLNIIELLNSSESIQNCIQKGCSSPEIFNCLSNQVYSDFLNILGGFYINKNDKDYVKVKNCFESSSKLMNSHGQNNLGNFYLHGYGCNKDFKLAKKYFELSSQQNNSNAINNLGFLYLNGLGVDENFQMAKNYFDLSFKLDNSYAMYNLGYLFEKGLGVDQNFEIAKHYYQQSADKNNSNALNNIGKLFKYGKGVQQNYEKAKEFFELSATKDNSNALYNLGFHYLECAEIKDFDKAIKYFELSASQNNSCSFNALGNIYKDGLYVKQNYEKARKYFEMGYKEGNTDSINHLADLYERGYGVIRDFLKAKYLFEQSAKNNNSDAMNSLGLYYYFGVQNYVQKDYTKAKEYFEKGCLLNNSYSILYLGNIYNCGHGVEKDYSKAFKLYKKSAKLKNPIAFAKIGYFYFKGYGVQKNYLKAKKYYEKSANKYIKSNYRLGLFFIEGIAFEVDNCQAIKYFKKCIEKGEEYYKFEHDDYYINIHNYKYYPSCNNIGTIHLIDNKLYDENLAKKFLEEAAFGEFPYGQNNCGLYFQFYEKHIGNAKHLFLRGSDHEFALAEYNLAHIYEIENEIEKSINCYIRVSKHENIKLIFRNRKINDRRLEASISIVACLANIKLLYHFLLKSSIIDAKKYFKKILSQLKRKNDELKYTVFIEKDYEIDFFKFVKRSLFNFSYLKTLLRSYDFDQYSNYDMNFNSIIMQTKLNGENKSDKIISNMMNKLQNIETNINHLIDCKIDINNLIENNINELFNLIIENELFTKLFLEKLNKFIQKMDEILYCPPYKILFGRVCVINPQLKAKQLNQDFYEGFGIKLNSITDNK